MKPQALTIQKVQAKSEKSHPSLFALTWPIFIEISLYMLMGSADTLMLSQYSDNSVAAVGVSNQLLNLLIVMFSFITTGTTIVIAQLLGASRKQEATQVAYVSLGTNFLISFVISLLMFVLAVPILHMMGLSSELMPDATVFLQIVGLLSFIQALIMTYSAILKSYGFTRDTMYVTIGMNLLNVAGNYLVIFGPFGFPVLGVMGVALSTSFARLIGLTAMILIVRHRIGLRFSFKRMFYIQRTHLKKLLKIGIPSAGEQLSYNGSQMIITLFITFMGTQALAAKVYTQNLMMFIMLFGAAISQGTQILIGRLIGAKEFDAAYRRCMKSLYWAIAISLLSSTALSLSSTHLLTFFTSNSEIIQIASLLLILTIILEPGRSFNMVIINSLRAAGDAKFPVYMAMISMWGIGLPIAYLLGIQLEMGLIGVWISFIVDEWVRGIFMYRRWRSRVWTEYRFTST
ncbi:MATE family efflux transporter [Bacillus altitudinis]|jgi:putative MATE family efflux protein|uniref:MATE family efflux transporter n=1 Tax=Bacillus TaxID=1386 RepID=UPI0003012947|nr:MULTISPECIES: MATE family efflux transporter [Bacillus]KOA82300.1 transporter [Bacillus stratosphericus]ATH71647.1 MATE family efflux transporter [Bacillus altitudinis]KRV43425.1 MATE family efflux transporter [Bacillus sp. TH007]MBR0579059.1 MATE family efflux transporter [Bacillus altitudinis A23-8]MCY7449766.1 MATE family efflux transporter [Bacillus altitudinis]